VALDGKWLHAQFNLAIKVVVHYAMKLWPWAPRFGLVRFQENYVVEGLAPVPADQRENIAHQAGRCTNCGACDDVCPILLGDSAVDAGAFMGPRAFVLAGARAAPMLGDIADTLAVLTSPTCTGCRRCDVVCPEQIPITALAAALSSQQAVVEAARRGTMPILPADVRAPQALLAAPSTTTPSVSSTSRTSNLEGDG
jgi:ferredoxin